MKKKRKIEKSSQIIVEAVNKWAKTDEGFEGVTVPPPLTPNCSSLASSPSKFPSLVVEAFPVVHSSDLLLPQIKFDVSTRSHWHAVSLYCVVNFTNVSVAINSNERYIHLYSLNKCQIILGKE